MWLVVGVQPGQERAEVLSGDLANVNVARILDPELEVMFVTDQCAGTQSFRSLAKGAGSRWRPCQALGPMVVGSFWTPPVLRLPELTAIGPTKTP